MNVNWSATSSLCCPQGLHETVVNTLLQIQNTGYKILFSQYHFVLLLKFARNHLKFLRQYGFTSIYEIKRLKKALNNRNVRIRKIFFFAYFTYNHKTKRVQKVKQHVINLFDNNLPANNKELNTLKMRSELTYCNATSTPDGKHPFVTEYI